jgi:hypothetical protein
MGNRWIVHGALMVFDVVATFGSAATATLGGGAVSPLGDVGRGGWGIRLDGHNCGELANCGKMLELGAGHSQDHTSKLFEDVGHRK